MEVRDNYFEGNGHQFSGEVSQEAIIWLGQMLLKGFTPQNQYTVAEWIDHVIDSKGVSGRKKKTLNGYRYCAVRVKEMIGYMRLCDVNPAVISDLFARLKKENVNTEVKAVLRKDVDITEVLLRNGTSKTRLAYVAQISQSTVDRAIKGLNVIWSKAEVIAEALNYKAEDLFDEVHIEKPLSSSTLESYRRFVSLVFSAAVRELQIPYNPVERVERTKKQRKRVEVLQPEDVQAVWAAAEKEPINRRCLIHMFLVTGGRRGEIAGLRWSRVYWDTNAIMIDHEILYTPEDGVYCEDGTKTGQDRLLRLPAETMQVLAEYREWQQQYKAQLGERWIESDYIFTGKYGGRIPPDSISGYINRFQARYNLPDLHPHKFRHTMASILIYSGMDPVTVSKRLGHASVSTTENIYAHLIKKADVESAECIADAIIRGKK